jgi:hypothetical protein
MISTLSRRSWIGLSGFALLGCHERKSPAAAASTPALVEPPLRAGPFSVSVPTGWVGTAVVEKVPMRPLHTAEEWKQVQTDLSFALKPGYYTRPLHWAIRLPAATPGGIAIDLEAADDDPAAAQILIHKADDWAWVMSDGTEKDPPGNSPRHLREMRKRLEAAVGGEDTIPFPAYMDAHVSFDCLKQRLDFDGGHGIRMIAQWMSNSDLMRTGGLHYLFSGMSDDDSCQIIATFPLNLPGLPDDSREATHLGRGLALDTKWLDNFEVYEREAVAWLSQHQAEIEPSLQTLDDMIRSLVVRHWE